MSLRPLLAIMVFGFGMAACSDDNDKSAASTTTSADAASSTTAPEATTTTVAAASTTTTLPRNLDSGSKLRLDGIGPVKVDMTMDEASAAIGRKLRLDQNSLADAKSTCGFADVPGGPQGLGFMVGRDTPSAAWKIERVDIIDPSEIQTGGGAHIGSTETQVKLIYGADKIKVEPHTYVEGGHYLSFDIDGPDGYLLLFETDGQRVTQFRSGKEGAVRAVEGCF